MIEKLSMLIAFKLPKRVVYWAAIRLMAYATCGKYGDTVVPELTGMEALKRWDHASG